jgi:hypothetical protein
MRDGNMCVKVKCDCVTLSARAFSTRDVLPYGRPPTSCRAFLLRTLAMGTRGKQQKQTPNVEMNTSQDSTFYVCSVASH